MKKIVLAISLVSLLTVSTVFGKAVQEIRGVIVDYTVNIDGGIWNRSLKNPLISYNDTTYVSIRDAMERFDRKVDWDGENEVINIMANDLNEIIVNNETAMLITQSILKENYSERINETTKYALVSMDADHIESEKIFVLYAVFDGEGYDEDKPKEIVENADIKITLSARNARTEIELLK